jgi:hypothetical protein
MRNKFLLIMEIIWIVLGVASVTAAVIYARRTGGSKTFIFLLMAIVSFGFAWFRHTQRKKS